VSGRGRRWARIVAGLAAIGSVLAPFLASEPFPDLSFSTAHGAWFDTLSASLYVTLALAWAIPMLAAADQGAGPAQAALPRPARPRSRTATPTARNARNCGNGRAPRNAAY
jgi:hypothetical protein